MIGWEQENLFHLQSEILLRTTIIDGAEYWVPKPEELETAISISSIGQEFSLSPMMIW